MTNAAVDNVFTNTTMVVVVMVDDLSGLDPLQEGHL